LNALQDILLVVNLLSSHSPVTIDTISKTCNVSRHTARQYIEVLMKATTLVYSDLDRGFRFAGKNDNQMNRLRIDEAIVVILALKQLSRIVNEAYRTVIHSLNQKILAHQPLSPDVASAILSSSSSSEVDAEDVSNFLTTHIVNTAVALNSQLELTLRGNGNAESTIAIAHPRLEYKRGWHVIENSKEENKQINFKDILRAAIIPYPSEDGSDLKKGTST